MPITCDLFNILFINIFNCCTLIAVSTVQCCIFRFQLHLSTPCQEINREEAESQRRIMDGSPPTPRSLRLARTGNVSASQEELRRYATS